MRRFLLVLFAAAWLAPAQPVDVLLRAMRDEMRRTAALKLVNPEQPYYIEYAIDDANAFGVTASLGALINERHNRFRIPRVQVRVGDYAFDNTNYVLSDFFFGARYDGGQLPTEDNYEALRHQLWLATDRAYKTAIEGIGRKKAALKNISQPETLPDFYRAEPVKKIANEPAPKIDEAAWKSRTLDLSRLFSRYPAVLGSAVETELVRSTYYLLTTEGTELRLPESFGYVRVRASGQAADGMPVRDHVVLHALDLNRFAPDVEMRQAVEQVAKNVTALAQAPVGEAYTGPVLLEGEAAAQVFAEILGSQLALPRRPVPEPGRPVPFAGSELEGRRNSRLLPAFLDVVDDPTQKEWRGRPLFGSFPVDIEGVVPQPLTVIEKGVLQNFLLTRQPVRDFSASNGRARIPGGFGHKAAYPSNLFVKNNEPVPLAELKKRLLAVVSQRGKPYGILVRKMDFPSSASFDEVRRQAASLGQQAGRITSRPLLVFRVYPDGREELVRVLRFRGLGIRSLRDILAASEEETVFDYIGSLAPMALMGAANYVAPATVVSPSVLFEDLELERPQEDLPKLPVVPPPPLEP
ncbi:MAG: metallopeptidase TldD-related protein [Bryobacter sp.]|nr:metallopeptidase TldD-related protein [Bryobacter sp.]